MNEIKIINKSTFLDKEIDVWGTVEQPLFRAKDVASWLGIKNVPDLVKELTMKRCIGLTYAAYKEKLGF